MFTGAHACVRGWQVNAVLIDANKWCLFFHLLSLQMQKYCHSVNTVCPDEAWITFAVNRCESIKWWFGKVLELHKNSKLIQQCLSSTVYIHFLYQIRIEIRACARARVCADACVFPSTVMSSRRSRSRRRVLLTRSASPPAPHFDKFLDVSGSAERLRAANDSLITLEV